LLARGLPPLIPSPGLRQEQDVPNVELQPRFELVPTVRQVPVDLLLGHGDPQAHLAAGPALNHDLLAAAVFHPAAGEPPPPPFLNISSNSGWLLPLSFCMISLICSETSASSTAIFSFSACWSWMRPSMMFPSSRSRSALRASPAGGVSLFSMRYRASASSSS